MLKHFYMKSKGKLMEMGYNQGREDVPVHSLTECHLKNNTQYRNYLWDLYSFLIVAEKKPQCGSLEIEMVRYHMLQLKFISLRWRPLC